MDGHGDRRPCYRKMQVLGPLQAIAVDDIATQRAEANGLHGYT